MIWILSSRAVSRGTALPVAPLIITIYRPRFAVIRISVAQGGSIIIAKTLLLTDTKKRICLHFRILRSLPSASETTTFVHRADDYNSTRRL